jgi:hypothetical protein
LEDVGVDGTMILKLILKNRDGESGFIWPPIINKVMTLRFPQNREFLVT